MNKEKQKEASSIASLLSVFPPLALAFIVAGWFKERKITPLSVIWAVAAIALSLIFAVQLYQA